MKQYFLSAVDTSFIAVKKKKKSEQMYMVRRQLKHTKMGLSHSQLNPVTEMTD